jgi:hypothetical protein
MTLYSSVILKSYRTPRPGAAHPDHSAPGLGFASAKDNVCQMSVNYCSITVCAADSDAFYSYGYLDGETPAPCVLRTLDSRGSKRVPRFYFHFASAQRVVHDDEGVDLSSLPSAHVHAVKLVSRTVRLIEAKQERWTVQIADETGALLLTMMFPVVGLRPAAFGRARADPDATPSRQVTQNTPAILRAYAALLRESARAPYGADPA